MATLIRDLIELPERVHRGDFVLRLAEGVARPEETLRDYVVTPQLATCFDQALAFIRSALDARSSRAAYLHGSFGSGKSHFMAVLYLLLQGDVRARSIPELAAIVARHSAWTEGKRFLLVPYHLIGARSLEAAILGGYAEHVRRRHPEAPLPGVYLATAIFQDAAALRERMGDAAFFSALNAGREPGGGGWGEIGATWDPARFETALAAPVRSEARTRLVGDLVDRFFTAYRGVAQGQDEGFVPLDDGLAIVSTHARSLGYDAVVLFLDELILWLASRAADPAFVSREGQKLAKLVEAQTADRPVPIVSFVARQRDLRELIGEHVTGAEQLAFGDVLKWWEARFHTITLEDRNLPAIAERRILRPRSEAARREMDRAFEETTRTREEVLATLLTSTADRAMFRQVYPFSPALVQTLVAVSSALQRERTALKVMLQILVDQRDHLKLGDLVPVGDLFDAIAEGDEPFSEAMRVQFENAKRLYHQKLLPMLEAAHGVRLEEVRGLAPDAPQAVAFRVDDRLVKTLLLAALVSEVEPLRALTPARLAALNHGTIRSPIPGREGQQVLGRLRTWAAQIGEIKVGEEPTNPTITVQLSAVDTQAILEKARSHDNAGNRRRKVRELLFAQLGVEDRDELFLAHTFTWRGTARSCELIYQNVRELPDESLRARGDDWKVVIDYPFDVEHHTPRDDVARIALYREAHREPSATLVWVPSFLSLPAQRDLGTLVILGHVLAGDRFEQYAADLSALDRAMARSLLDNQRSQLRQRLIAYLEGAYGVTSPPPGSVDKSHELEEHVQSLDPTFRPRPPAGANLGEAFQQLLEQALDHQFPGHPRFEAEVRPAVLRRVWAEVQRATQHPEGRIEVDRPLRPLMRQVAVPLRLGEMGETHFVLGHHWRMHFERKAAQESGAITVARLRVWMDDPRPMGLPREVQNLLVLLFAEQTNRSFLLHGGPVLPTLEALPDELELREQALPPAADWDAAVPRAGAILGVTASPLRSAASVVRFVEDVRGKVGAVRAACERLARRLRETGTPFGVPADAPRLRTADAVLELVEAVAAARPEDVVRALARARVETSEVAMGQSLARAAALADRLDATRWELLEAIGRLTDARAAEAEAIRDRIADALGKDEYAVALGPALADAESRAVRLLTSAPSTPPPEPAPPPGRRVVVKGARQGLTPAEGRQVLSDLGAALDRETGTRLDLTWEVYRPEAER